MRTSFPGDFPATIKTHNKVRPIRPSTGSGTVLRPFDPSALRQAQDKQAQDRQAQGKQGPDPKLGTLSDPETRNPKLETLNSEL